jgi:23S rRNA (uridine2552-2'-O)-methyltransferase
LVTRAFCRSLRQKAQKDGWRARSAYKLIEIQERFKLIKSNMNVVDLGAAPGGWSDYVARLVKPRGKVYALDILPMAPLDGVEFIEGDFSKDDVVASLIERVGEHNIDVVLSDIAPNMSGVNIVDQARSMNLAETAYYFADKVLKPGGAFLVKVFQGAGFDEFLKLLRSNFTQVKIIKPEASRARSKEIYLCCIGSRKP